MAKILKSERNRKDIVALRRFLGARASLMPLSQCSIMLHVHALYHGPRFCNVLFLSFFKFLLTSQ